MDIQLYIWPIVVFLGASLVLALPSTKSQGCLAYVVRMLAFLTGSISPILVLWRAPGVAEAALRWQFPGSLLTYLAILVALVLGACAVTLVAAGLQILLRRGRGDFEDKLDLSWFGLPDFSSNITNNLDLAGCIGIALFVLLGGLFWFGLALGSSIKDFFTPREKTRSGRVLQSVYSLFSGLVIFGLGAGLLFFLSREAGATPRAATPPNVFIEVPAPGSPNDVKYLPGDLPARLDEVWRGVDKDNSLSWEPAYTPLFPTEWPPLPRTLWVSYAYATSPNTDVTDAIVVGAPWAIVEYSAGRTPTAKVIPLGNRVEQVGLQGTTPLHAGDGNSLSKKDAVFTYCLTLTAPPDESSSEVADIRAFYNTWMRLNGTIASLIRSNHLQFLRWVEPRQ